MKRAMRVQAVGKKLTLITAAFILAVSTLTASLPFILSEKASAVSGYSYGNVSLNSASWQVDRQAPSGYWNLDAANNRALLSVNQLKSSSDPFRKTEGMSTSVPAGTSSISGSVYVNSDWSDKKNLRVGLWGVTNTPDVSWPIIEYANLDTYEGWRIWDTEDANGRWVPLNIAGAGNYKLEILIDKTANKFRFFINNSEVATSETFSAGGKVSFSGLILNSYNVGSGNAADNYVAEWKNLKYGRIEAPVINTAPVYVNSSEDNDVATWTHGGVNVKNFEYREYLSLAAANADVNADMNGDGAAYWITVQGPASRSQTVGQSWTGEAKLYYRVVAIDVYGHRSAPSAVGTVVIDKKAPEVTLPANSGVVKDTLLLTGTVNDASGISEYRYQILDANKNNLTGPLASYGYSRAGGTSAVVNGTLAEVDTSVLPSGNYTIRVWAFDNAGNRTGTKNVPHVTEFTVDRTAPAGTFSFSNNGQPTRNNVTVTLNTDEPIDTPSGWTFVSSTQFTKVVSSNGTSTVAVQDVLGNSGELQYSVTGIDKRVKGALYAVSTTTTTPVVSGVLAYNVDNTPVQGVALDIYINGVKYERTTDQKGEWSVSSAVFNDGATNVVAMHLAGVETPLASGTVATRVPTVSAPEVVTTSNPDTRLNGGLPFTTFGAAQTLGVADSAPVNATDGAQEVKGTSTEKTLASAIDANNTNGSAMGLAWYWWLLIVAAVSLLGWWITAAVRNREQS